MKKFLGALIILFALANFSLVSAEIVTVEGKGHYFINRKIKETFEEACEHAYTEALNNAAEHAKVAIRNSSRMKNFELEEYNFETAAGAIPEVIEDKPYNGITSDGHIEIFYKIVARVDTSKVQNPKEIKASSIKSRINF